LDICRNKLTASMYFPFTPLILKSYISFTGSQCELHTLIFGGSTTSSERLIVIKNFNP